MDNILKLFPPPATEPLLFYYYLMAEKWNDAAITVESQTKISGNAPQQHSLQQQAGSDTPQEALVLSNNPVAQRQDVASDDTSQGAINNKYGNLSCLSQIRRQNLLRKK